MKLVNIKEMMEKALVQKYAVPHININNLEWLKAVLITAQKMNSPMIVGVSEGAIKYMGGYKTVVQMTKAMLSDLNITVPVALHLDHGKYDAALKAIDAGFSSIMFDGSSLSFEENYSKTKELIALTKKKNLSFEAEVGAIAGDSYGDKILGELANVDDAIKMTKLGIDALAAGIGNIHGIYPKGWTGLNFERLKKLSDKTKIGIVLHGGSGIPIEQIQKAISLGVTKINVNTELQQVNHKAIREFILSDKDLEGKNFDPRKLYKPGYEAICKIIEEKIKEFGSVNKA